MKKSFLRPDEIAFQLNVSRRTVYRLIREGALIAFPVRQGGCVRVPVESFQRYVNQQIKDYQIEQGIVIQKSASADDRI